MSLYKGNSLIAGGRQCMPLLSFMWADHTLNDASWLRADTYSWQSGAVYQAAYEHLYNDVNIMRWRRTSGGTTYNIYTDEKPLSVGNTVFYLDGNNQRVDCGVIDSIADSTHIVISSEDSDYNGKSFTLNSQFPDEFMQSETIAGVTVQFYLADDGHKICPDTEESNVSAIYNSTGVAWYYIIDTVNTRFKLPRTQFAFTGIRNGVGAFVEAGLPNITGTINGLTTRHPNDATTTGAFYKYSGSSARTGDVYAGMGIGFSAQNSNSIYGNSDTVQPKATEMYLYFYVGNFTQTALENTAGLNASLFNGKVDVGHEVIAFQEPTAGNNYTWYRKYADGWVEQGGIFPATSGWATSTISLPITMQDMYYTLTTDHAWTTSDSLGSIIILTKTTTNFSARYYSRAESGYSTWFIAGMAAN